MKTNKTPYEIRTDLLHLAHAILVGKAQAEASVKVQNEGTTLVSHAAPTTEEIIAEATKLNAFVSSGVS
jgi:hypothetical protein